VFFVFERYFVRGITAGAVKHRPQPGRGAAARAECLSPALPLRSASPASQTGRVGDDLSDLPLFTGPHIPKLRFERALDRLDLGAALADAPEAWRDAVAEMAAVLEEKGPARSKLEKLVRCRRKGWPDLLERTWQRLLGRCLDARGIPGVLDREPAAAFLLRGGERERAWRSVRRHLDHHPRDPQGWALLAHFEPVLGAARCAFHGGPVLDVADHLVEMVMEDELEPVGPWLLSYGWFSRDLGLDDIARALTADGTLTRPPLPVPGDARAFAWYLLDAGGRSLGPDSPGVVEARQRLQRISRVAFRRYLARVAARPF